MNKTVNINISGMVFHIEEDAYDALKKYMHEIKLYFSRSAEDTEVVTDIENRIAEMFSEILKTQNREVIVLKDVEGIIAQIGQVSDFEETAEAEEAAVPGEEIRRRLFRDPDDKKLGGVCAGVSHYFGWDPIWLRIITALLTIFTSGIVAVIYVILWMVMPPAKTLVEKMAMKGERFHLSNFRKTFDEEMSGVKETFNHIRSEVSNPDNATSFKKFMNELIDLVVRLIRGLGKIILPAFAILLIAFGAIWVISTVVGLVSYASIGSTEFATYFPFNVMDQDQQAGFALSLAGLIGIPALAIILLGARLLLKTRIMSAPIGMGMLAVWLVALGFTVYYCTSTLSYFRQGASVRQITELESVSGNTWYLELDGYSPQGYRNEWEDWNDWDDWEEWDEDLYEVDLRIEQSNTGRAALVQVFNSRGKDFNDAAENAQKIRYGFTQQDSVLRFGDRFSLKENALWRAQETNLTLQLPAGSNLIIGRNMRRILENHEIWSHDFDRVGRWIVTADGLRPTADSANSPAAETPVTETPVTELPPPATSAPATPAPGSPADSTAAQQ